MLIIDGLVYPGIVKNPLRRRYPKCGDKDCFMVRVSGEEYAICVDPDMWSSSKSGYYGAGLANTADDPKKIERTSRLGEIACAKVFPGIGVDIMYKKGGESIDFHLRGVSADVKTATWDTDANCIQVVNESGKEIPLKSQIYIASFIWVDARDLGYADVVLVGWQWRDVLLSQPTEPARRKFAKNLNKEMCFADCKPIELLYGTYMGNCRVA